MNDPRYRRQLGGGEDPYAQVDGDHSGAVQFQGNSAGMPWLRNGVPPWHLWGNSQQVSTIVETVGVARQGVTNQLVKIAYKRPETWHWMFSARLISGPANTATFFTRIFVQWELYTGVGRSLIHITSEDAAFDIRAFEEYTFQWGPTRPAFPVGAHIWSTAAETPSRSFQGDGPATLSDSPISEIVAQDIQLRVQVIALTVSDNVAAVGQPVVVEVSAQFAPLAHVRPDWYMQRQPAEVLFGGDEIGGR